MAASVAPTPLTSKTVRETYITGNSASIISTTVREDTPSKANNKSQSASSEENNTQQITLNSQELCRSCGKTSDDLYDLYHPSSTTVNSNIISTQSSMADETTTTAIMSSPFTTSSTTCYSKSSAATQISSHTTSTTSCSSATSSNSNTAATTNSNTTTFDSAAATAKATAKGQSNMENILQEMQIWHLQIKCNDGLPQRICAKCTAQFYMIHKFRRKCLKVQAQLRGLYEEQQQLKGERLQEQHHHHRLIKQEEEQHAEDVLLATKEAIKTPRLENSKDSLACGGSSTELLILDNANYEQLPAANASVSPKAVLLSFDINPGNTNDATKPPPPAYSASRLQDNVLETMDVDTETMTIDNKHKSSLLSCNATDIVVIPTDRVIAPAFNKEHNNSEHAKKQKCDNNVMTMPHAKRKRVIQDHCDRRSRSIDKCDDAKLTNEVNECFDNGIELRDTRGMDRRKNNDILMRSRSSPECLTLPTKAALKSYCNMTTRAATLSSSSSTCDRQPLIRSLTDRAVAERHHALPQHSMEDNTATESRAIMASVTCPVEQVSISCAGEMVATTFTAATATGKTRNDNNNNSHQQQQNETVIKEPQLCNINKQATKTTSIDNPLPNRNSTHKSSSKSSKSKKKMEIDELSKQPRQESLESQQLEMDEAVVSRHSPKTSQNSHENSTSQSALCSSPTSNKKTDCRKRGSRRRRRQEAEATIRTSSPQSAKTTDKQYKSIQQQQQQQIAYENKTLLTNKQALGKTELANKFASLNSLKDDAFPLSPTSVCPSSSATSYLCSAAATTVTTPAELARNPVKTLKEDCKAILANNNINDIKWQLRRTQRLSTSSLSSLSSSSSSELTTSDDDDDDDDDLDGDYYEMIEFRRLHGLRTNMNMTTIPSMCLWKTKGEMKANPNDMEIFKSTTTFGERIKPILSDNYETNSRETSIEIATNNLTCSITEGMRSHTLDDSSDAKKETKSQQTSNTQQSHSNQFERPEFINAVDPHCTPTLSQNSAQPEEADQKQIKLKQKCNNHCDDANSNGQYSEAKINYNSKESNKVEEDDENKAAENENKIEGDSEINDSVCKQKPAISIPIANSNDATTPTVGVSNIFVSKEVSEDNPSRGGGSMKLILQRRSSNNFMCRRKEDILEERAAAVSYSSPCSSAPTSPQRKRKRKQRKEEKLSNRTKQVKENNIDVEPSKPNTDDIPDNTTEVTKRNSKRSKSDETENCETDTMQPEAKRLQLETNQNDNEKIQDKTNNENDQHLEHTAVGLEQNLSEQSNVDLVAPEITTTNMAEYATKDAADEKLDHSDSVSVECSQATEDKQQLLIRVPLTSLTHDFKRMHLTKDQEVSKVRHKIDENKDQIEESTEAETDNETKNQSCSPDELKNRLESVKEKELLDTQIVSDHSKNEFHQHVKTNQGLNDDIPSVLPHNDANIENIEYRDCRPTNAEFQQKDNTRIDCYNEEQAIDKENKNNALPTITIIAETLKSRNDNMSSTLSSDVEDQDTRNFSETNPFVHATYEQTAAGGCVSSNDSKEAAALPPLHSDILELVQESGSVGAVEEMSEPKNCCGASSKITDFINDFQNTCIDSPDVHVESSAIDALPSLPHQHNATNQNLIDEIRDVEDTLNGILNEMHDRDMYTPRAGETEDFLAHSSIYSPMTEAPTTPSQSLYAESPRTVNSNPMSLSPYIPTQMDYNAMTPQSSHSSSMSGHTTTTMSGNSSHRSGGVSSDHFPSYTECFAEESTQSELIGFQNDIPCFENIDLTLTDANGENVAVEPINAGDVQETTTPTKEYTNKDLLDSLDKSAVAPKDHIEGIVPTATSHLAELTEIVAPEHVPGPEEVLEINESQYHPEAINPTIVQTNISTNLQQQSTHMPQQYVITNTPHGPVLISAPGLQNTPQEPAQPTQQNIQYVTLDSNHATSKLGWSNQVSNNSLTTPSTATTYFLNSSGEIYLSNQSFNTVLVPPHTSVGEPSAVETSDNYVQVLQAQPTTHHQQQPQHHQHQPPPPNNSSQYIMLVNNLGTAGQQQYITNPNQTVLLHTPVSNNNCSYITSQPATADIDLNRAQVSATTMPSFSITTSLPAAHANVSLTSVAEASATAPKDANNHDRMQKLLQQKNQQRPTNVSIQPRTHIPRQTPPNRTQKINLICRFCHKRPKFTNNVDYSNHIISMHPAEKPYNCDYCPKHFQRRSERQDHVAQVHGSRYQCAQCSVSFCAQRALDFHLQKYHASTETCTIPPRIATVAPTQQLVPSSSSSASSMPALVNRLQQNSTSSTSSSASSPSTYHLLHNSQQQRLVRAAEDVHAHHETEEEETKNNKCSYDSQLDIMDETTASQQQQEEQQHQQYKQPTRKLCCPDCDGDDETCCSIKNNPQQIDHKQVFHQQQQYGSGNRHDASGLNEPQLHITLPSPEQTEPDSTTTLRHFRKSSMKSPSINSVSPITANNNSSSNHSSNTYAANTYANSHSNYESSSNPEYFATDKYIPREVYNCHLCNDTFGTANALRRHRNITHNNHCTMPFVCTICKRGFRLRNALQRHMETHDAEGRPYECNICQVRFPRPSQLTLHKLTVHKFEKVHTCDECGKQFGTESSLKAHEKVAHDANSMPLPFACVYLEAPKIHKPKISDD